MLSMRPKLGVIPKETISVSLPSSPNTGASFVKTIFGFSTKLLLLLVCSAKNPLVFLSQSTTAMLAEKLFATIAPSTRSKDVILVPTGNKRASAQPPNKTNFACVIDVTLSAE